MRRWLLISMIMLFAYPALAVVLRSNGTLVIEKGQTIDDDVIVSGGTVQMRGTVTKDLVVAAGTIEIDGQVGGDLIAAGGNITVSQPIGGTVYLAGGDILLASTVGRNAVITGGTIRVNDKATISRDLVVSGGNVNVAGTVTRDVRGSAGTFTLQDGARIGRNLIITTSNPQIAAGAVIEGKSIINQPEKRKRERGGAFGFLLWLFWVIASGLALLITGLVLVAAAPRLTEQTQTMLRTRPWASLLTGLILLIITPIIAALLIFPLLITFPLGLILYALYFIALYISPIFTAILIGRLIMRDQRRSLNLALLIGIALFTIVRLIPCLGGLVSFVAMLFGLGALALTVQARSARPLYPLTEEVTKAE